MSPASVKLAYVAAHFKVKAEVTKAQCLAAELPPADVFARARAKMQSVSEQGEIVLFTVHEEGFTAFWKAFRQAKDLGNNVVLTYNLAEGVPPLSGFKVEATQQEKAIAEITVSASVSEVRQWRLEWLLAYTHHSLASLGIRKTVNTAQLHGTWLKAASGEKVERVPISENPPPPTDEERKTKPYSIIANKARNEITFIVRDIRTVTQTLTIQKIHDFVKDAAQKVQAQFGGRYHIMQKEIASALTAAAAGPEAVGLNLPVVILAASAHGKAPVNQVFNTSYPGAGKLDVVIAQDASKATIGSFDKDMYLDRSFSMNEEWLMNEVRRHGVLPEFITPVLQDVMKRIARKDGLNDIVVASGIPSVGGSGPFLYSKYLEANVDESTLASEKVDIRDLQQRQIVKKGQLVAEIRYQTPPTIGRDVFGNDLPMAESEPFKVTLGDGIVERDYGKFYADTDGVPEIKDNVISISKTLVHKGDVNLRSGNIKFDGPVEITGSIDSGSYVETKGDLKVKGSIRGAIVRAGGEIEVGSGITTGEKGLVVAKRGIKADFIENSKIQCGGTVLAKKAILNCDIIAGGNIEVSDRQSGVIAGGNLSCRFHIKAGQLGFKNGAVTNINTGVDWRIERSVRIREGRKKKVEEVQAADRQALREVMGRKKNQMTAKHEQRKIYYQNRLVKERVLLEKVERHLQKVRSQLVYDPEVVVFVPQTLFSNVNLNVGGTIVPVKQDMAGVGILGKKKSGSNVIRADLAERLLKGDSSEEIHEEDED